MGAARTVDCAIVATPPRPRRGVRLCSWRLLADWALNKPLDEVAVELQLERRSPSVRSAERSTTSRAPPR
jgi:hypothetical protein